MANRKQEPWAPPLKPSKRKRWRGFKLPIRTKEFEQELRELDLLQGSLNAYAEGKPTELEERHGVVADFYSKSTIKSFSDRIAWNVFNLGFSSMGDPAIKTRFDFKKIIKTIPDLKGQIIGGHTIVRGHRISFKKFTSPILSKYGDVISENAGMRADCSCGWFEKDILPKVLEIRNNITNFADQVQFGLKPKQEVNFQLLEKFIMEHIQGTFVEMEYIVITQEFLEDVTTDFCKALLSLLKTSGAVLHFDFDIRDYIVIDDAMSDAAIAELTEMLAGYEVGTRKVRVLRP